MLATSLFIAAACAVTATKEYAPCLPPLGADIGPLQPGRFVASLPVDTVLPLPPLQLEGNLVFALPRESATVGEAWEAAHAFCDAHMDENRRNGTFCPELLFARACAQLQWLRESPVLATPEEGSTPLHSTVAEEHIGGSLGLAERVRRDGLVVLGELIPPELRGRLRRIVLEKRLEAGTQSRYSRAAFCSFQGPQCRAWDPALFDIAEHPRVMAVVTRILGNRPLLDSATVSVQASGVAGFGPHVDRPFLLKESEREQWPYSSDGMPLPPQEYPLSLQLVVLLDNFTSHTDAFYVLPTQRSSSHHRGPQDSAYAALPEGRFPPLRYAPKLVTGLAGDAILANGALWHGAAPNFSPRPRVALLLQFVPRFVRPGVRFPAAMLPPSSSRMLRDLFDVRETSNRVITATAPDGSEHVFSYDRGTVGLAHVYGDFSRFARTTFGDDAMDSATLHRLALAAEANAREQGLLHYEVCHAPQSRLGAATTSMSSASRTTAGAAAATAYAGARVRRNRNVVFPRIAFGTAGVHGDELVERVAAALAAGIRHLDLAEMYANQHTLGHFFRELWPRQPVEGQGPQSSQRRSGGEKRNTRPWAAQAKAMMMPKRSEVFITSKLWATNMAPEHVGPALEATLAALQLDYLDAWLIHWPVPLAHVGGVSGPANGHAYPRREDGEEEEEEGYAYASGFGICDTWRAMEDQQRRGLVRHLGVSNTPPALLHNLLGCVSREISKGSLGWPLMNQVEAHLYLPQHDLLRFCKINNVALQAYSPLAAGQLTQHPLVREVASELGWTPAQVLFRWLLQRGVALVTTTGRKDRMADLVAVEDLVLPDAAMARLTAVTERTRLVNPEPFAFLW